MTAPFEWLPGAKKLPIVGEDGGAQLTAFPARLALHTTEGGGTVESLAAYYRTSTYWPNLTADVVHREIAQHIPFSRAGRALQHPLGTIDTNRAHCWQIEIIGWAADGKMANGQPRPANMVMPHLTDDQVDWLGGVLAPLFDVLGLARHAATFVAGGAGTHAPQRLTENEWKSFGGVCGHQHVPNNDHYDPGAFRIERFLTATETGNPLPTPGPGGDMWYPPITKPVADASRHDPKAQGYWCVNELGEVQAFGAAVYHGGHGAWLNADGEPVPAGSPDAKKRVLVEGGAAGLAPTPSGNGYWILSKGGSMYTFGDAEYRGDPHP